jgi:branched-chain amino acid transport system substrate-binding protein
MQRVYEDFRRRFPQPRDDYFQARTVVMIEMLVRAIERAGSLEPLAVARALSGSAYSVADGNPLGEVTLRAADHQLIGPLVVSVMDRQGAPGVRHDVEGSGYGFRSELRVPAGRRRPADELPPRMARPVDAIIPRELHGTAILPCPRVC